MNLPPRHLRGGSAAVIFVAILLVLIPCRLGYAQSRDADNTHHKKKVIRGKASFYGGSDGFDGQTTANGDTFDHHDHTAAAKTIPLGSEAKVTNLKTGKSTKVTVTDRGPYVPGRKIDFSKDAAKEIGITKKEGVAPVKIEVVKPPVKEASTP